MYARYDVSEFHWPRTNLAVEYKLGYRADTRPSRPRYARARDCGRQTRTGLAS